MSEAWDLAIFNRLVNPSYPCKQSVIYLKLHYPLVIMNYSVTTVKLIGNSEQLQYESVEHKKKEKSEECKRLHRCRRLDSD